MNRREILERLARKEITQDQAERMLKEVGTPIPETPPPAKKPGNRGCLIAILIALLGIPLWAILAGVLLPLFAKGCAGPHLPPQPVRKAIQEAVEAATNYGEYKPSVKE